MCCDHTKSTHYNTIEDNEGFSSKFYKCNDCSELYSTVELRVDFAPGSSDLDMLELAKKLIAMKEEDRGIIVDLMDKYSCQQPQLH